MPLFGASMPRMAWHQCCAPCQDGGSGHTCACAPCSPHVCAQAGVCGPFSLKFIFCGRENEEARGRLFPLPLSSVSYVSPSLFFVLLGACARASAGCSLDLSPKRLIATQALFLTFVCLRHRQAEKGVLPLNGGLFLGEKTKEKKRMDATRPSTLLPRMPCGFSPLLPCVRTIISVVGHGVVLLFFFLVFFEFARAKAHRAQKPLPRNRTEIVSAHLFHLCVWSRQGRALFSLLPLASDRETRVHPEEEHPRHRKRSDPEKSHQRKEEKKRAATGFFCLAWGKRGPQQKMGSWA